MKTLNSASPRPVNYALGSYFLVDKKHRVGKRIALRSTGDMSRSEVSHRTYRPQKEWFFMPRFVHGRKSLPYARAREHYMRVEKPMIWSAFDVPERVTLLMNDMKLQGLTKQIRGQGIDSTIHWLRECRYWRAIGITKPFMGSTLRANAWRRHGTDTGNLVFSSVMRDAVLDLERAVKRKEQGLAPNYLWDKWGPMGFTDGSRSDLLPRMNHNPYRDPDGVDVTYADIQTYTTHEQLKERYAEFINPDEATFAGSFMTPSNAGLTIADVADGSLVEYYTKLKQADGVPESSIDLSNAQDLRYLMYIAGNDALRTRLAKVQKWSTLERCVKKRKIRTINSKVDFARLLHNTRDDITRVRRFYEEKCGFRDFMNTSDKVITGAVINCLQDMRRMVRSFGWARQMMAARSELEWEKAMGKEAYDLYTNLEESILDKRRRTWATRFSGEANEEKALDFMLENFGRRSSKGSTDVHTVNSEGAEYDREREPVGRNIQRRVLGSDKKQAAERPHRRTKRAADPLASLHRQQLQNSSNFGVH